MQMTDSRISDKRWPRSLGIALMATLFGCGGTSADTGADSAGAAADTIGDADAADTASPPLRDTRYCEILLGTIGTDTVHIDVYSTEGLNDCPDASWKLLDSATLKTATGVDVVLLNGPRYWMLDSLSGSALQDTTVKTFGTIDMRKAGQIDVPTAGMATLSKPYQQHLIHRQSAFHWLAGQPVYELHDADGHAYAMQSFSVQKQPLTVADLSSLAAKLTGLPTGWSYAPRVLDKDLDLLALAGDATVVQDELGNTYSMQ